MINATSERHVLFGAFKGYGDILCAVPTIISELGSGSFVHVLIFPQLAAFFDVIDFGIHSSRVRRVVLPLPINRHNGRDFVKIVRQIPVDFIWISPHAVRRDASWKIPVLIWLLKKIYWSQATLGGASNEPGSFLFDEKIPIDRSLPLVTREWTAYSLASGRTDGSALHRAKFSEAITSQRDLGTAYDVVFHPGASWNSKRWSLANCVELVGKLSADLKVVILGLPAELAALRSAVSESHHVTFVTGSILDALATIARSRVAVTMDSGAMHFANVLDVQSVSLFGPTDPSAIMVDSAVSNTIFHKRLSCQACWNSRCAYEHVYCMALITPAEIEFTVRRLLKLSENRQ